MKKILKYTLYIIFIPVLVGAFFILYASLRDFKPQEKIELQTKADATLISDSVFSLLSWNIGYAGLGEKMDFFYDGGKSVRCSKPETIDNFNQIKNFLTGHQETDFIALQEVDIYAKRTYYINQKDSLNKVLSHQHSVFAENYKVDFVPVPLSNPMGEVQAGLMTFSQYESKASYRYALPGNYAWPNALFMLDRCFIADYFPISNGKDLIIINTHNSAYDDGSLKEQQLEYLKHFIQEAYQNGHFVLVAGDWNQNPPNFDISASTAFKDNTKFRLSAIDSTLLPSSWTWVFDPNTPTNRSNASPYKKGVTATTVLDFFLLSPNLELSYVHTFDLDFKNSDHNPVLVHFKLKY